MTDAPEIVEMSDSEDAALSNESIREEKQPTIDPVTDIFLGQLRETISQQHNKAVFACDGAVPISNNGTPSDKRVISAPVALRWDGPAEALSKDRKLILPLEPETEGKLENLANDTEPASFGLQGQDVFDENYRKASKMDIDKFASTFNPYELGIVDTIAQILLPSILDSKHHRAVRAELYKLNVMSPSFAIYTSFQHFITRYRYTPGPLASSKHTWTPLAPSTSLAHLSVFLLSTKVANYKSATKARR